MKNFNSWFIATVIATLVVLFTASKPAQADTYQVFDLGSGQRGLVGIEASGAVVLFNHHEYCGFGYVGFCYETWVNGALAGKSRTNPDSFDNGTPCVPSDAPAEFNGYLLAGACNNGREVYGTNQFLPSSSGRRGIYTGPDPATDFFMSGLLDYVDLNSSGDFAFLINQFHGSQGEIYQAIDLTTAATPEPGSIVLLGTGVLTALVTMRRRLSQHR